MDWGFMRNLGWRSAAVAAAGALITAVAGLAAAVPAAAASGPVSTTPAAGTPELTNTSQENVRQIVQCGSYMYVVGNFTTIKRYSTTYSFNNAFRFSAASPYTVDTTWKPNPNGFVNTIGFNGGNCSDAYIGGKFTTVGGGSATDIAEINSAAGSTGALVSTFKHNANGQVETIASAAGHLLVGGYFTSINNNGGTDRYMASLSPTTGSDDGFLKLGISGNYQFCSGTKCTSSNPTRVYNQQLSHGGTLDLVEGDFTSVGGVARRQIFMLNLSGTQGSVTPWTSPEWDGSDPAHFPDYNCAFNEPFYLQAAAWSPDDSTIYIDTTGYHPYNEPTGTFPRTGLCDAAASFPATQGVVHHNWVNYTGCDSLYAAAADGAAFYVAGHERWLSNPSGCDFKGPGAIVDPGLGGLSPSNGSVLGGSTPLYTRSRGLGADDAVITSGGLWIASDNGTIKNGVLQYSQTCDGVSGHAGICFLPYG
jgi:hypothetical protein